MNDKEQLLKKIKALADRGEGGETLAAAAILDRLMEKYHITEADLRDDAMEIHEFKWSKPFEDKLLDQIAYMVIGKYDAYKYTNSRAKVRLVKCTQAQRIEITAAFDFYREYLAEGLARYFKAFIMAENIMPDVTKERDDNASGLTFEEIALAAMLDKHERHAALTDGRKERSA